MIAREIVENLTAAGVEFEAVAVALVGENARSPTSGNGHLAIRAPGRPADHAASLDKAPQPALMVPPEPSNATIRAARPLAARVGPRQLAHYGLRGSAGTPAVELRLIKGPCRSVVVGWKASGYFPGCDMVSTATVTASTRTGFSAGSISTP